jgi:hypothetical protein
MAAVSECRAAGYLGISGRVSTNLQLCLLTPIRNLFMSNPRQRIPVSPKKDRASIDLQTNTSISSAVTEKLAALATLEYLEAKAMRASRENFEAVLAKVPDVAPIVAEDEWHTARR